MNSLSNQESMDGIAHFLGHVRKKRVRLWLENGELHYKAPKNALTREDIERFRASRGQIVAFLERSTGAETAEPKLGPRQQFDRVPLTFSQLTHWRSHRLHEQPSIRTLASATRLRGRLDIGLLHESLTETVRRHEALRTRIVVADGLPTQEITESSDCKLGVDDFTALSEDARDIEVRHLIDQLILEPVHLAVDPLFKVRLAKLRDDEHVLIVTMEHIISDAFSLNILLRDLFTIYMQALDGRALFLPAIPIQFADYAVWRRDAHTSWIERHGAYWDERLRGCQRLRFPESDSSSAANRMGCGTVPLKIGKNLKAELREWCLLGRTTLVMSVFTAYVGLVLRWCNEEEGVFPYQTDGRFSPKVENTIGYFASVLYLRIELRDSDSFVDLLNRVTKEYCKAYEHADFSYIGTQVHQAEFMRNAGFNWVSQEPKSDLSKWGRSEDAITACPVSFTHPVWERYEADIEPLMLLYDSGAEIVGGVHYPLNRFSKNTMERFGLNFLVFLKTLLKQPQTRVKDILLL